MADTRLPSHIRPIHYDLSFDIDLDLEHHIFEGTAAIEIEVGKPADELLLHCNGPKIESLYVLRAGIELALEWDVEDGMLCIRLKAPIEAGSILLYASFSAELDDTLSGLYRSRYTRPDGSEAWMATTQFEAPYARKAFPCFDEPEMKATFGVTMTADAGLTLISNMPEAEEAQSEDRRTVRFQTSPRMSTYLLFMAAGEFAFIEDHLGDTLIRVAAVPGKQDQMAFALKLTKDFLAFFEEYSGIPYPLPKLDMLAIPDFAAGAMENWGAITFREVLLLFDPESTSSKVKKRIAEVIAHELWHQWSGNLVTMKWWDDLWLNEAFATYVAFKAVDHYYPEWHMWEDFVSMETGGAFAMDILESTHPIAVPVDTPNEIEEIFDAISYGKGGSVLRMIEGYIGSDDFRQGVHNYLSDFAYRNAAAEDLWDHLEKASSKPVKAVLQSWVNQPGFPVITATMIDDTCSLTQQRLSPTGPTGDQQWLVPMKIFTKNEAGQSATEMLMDAPAMSFASGDIQQLKLNAGQEGFFRCAYNPQAASLLFTALSSGSLSVLDRWGTESDMFSLGRAGMHDLADYLRLVNRMQDEDSSLVLQSLHGHMKSIFTCFDTMDDWPEVEAWLRKHSLPPFAHQFERLGWDAASDESQEDLLLRAVSTEYLVLCGERQACDQAMERFARLLDDPSSIHPDIKSAVLSAATRHGTQKDYEALKERFEQAAGPEDKIRFLGALASFRSEETARDFADYVLSGKVRVQDIRTALPALMYNPCARPWLLDWVKDNWKTLETYKKTHSVFMGLLSSLITTLFRTDERAAVHDFLESQDTGYTKTKTNAYETAAMLGDWVERNTPILQRLAK